MSSYTLVLAFVAQLIALVYCNYADGELTEGLLPTLRYQDYSYKVYQHVYGMQWTNAYIDQTTNSIFFQADHTKCPNGNSCGDVDYTFLTASLNDLQVKSVTIQKGKKDIPSPEAQTTARYTPVMNDKYVYLIGGATGNLPFNLYMMSRNTSKVQFLAEVMNARYMTAAGIITGNSTASIFAIQDKVMAKYDCSDLTCKPTLVYYYDITPIQMVSDGVEKVYLIGYNNNNHVVIVPVDTATARLVWDKAYDITPSTIPDKPDATVVAAFITGSSMYISMEYRNGRQMDANDVQRRTGYISKINLENMQREHTTPMGYRGMINCYTNNGTHAFFGTSGSTIIVVELKRLHYGSSVQTMLIQERAGTDYSPGTLMKFNGLALSADSKTLIATADWWGHIAKIDLTRFGKSDPYIPRPDENDLLNVGFIIFGVLSSVLIFIIIGIVGIVAHCTTKGQYNGVQAL